FAVDLREWTITGGLKTDAGRDRVVPIHPKIQPYIQHWMAASGPRLIHRDGRPIAVNYYRRELYYPALERAGIKRHLTPRIIAASSPPPTRGAPVRDPHQLHVPPHVIPFDTGFRRPQTKRPASPVVRKNTPEPGAMA